MSSKTPRNANTSLSERLNDCITTTQKTSDHNNKMSSQTLTTLRSRASYQDICESLPVTTSGIELYENKKLRIEEERTKFVQNLFLVVCCGQSRADPDAAIVESKPIDWMIRSG